MRNRIKFHFFQYLKTTKFPSDQITKLPDDLLDIMNHFTFYSFLTITKWPNYYVTICPTYYEFCQISLSSCTWKLLSDQKTQLIDDQITKLPDDLLEILKISPSAFTYKLLSDQIIM